MNKELLKKTFREWKKAAKADYAITYPDNLGDCNSCVGYALCEKYGEESKGIFLKHWTHGMNADKPVEKVKSVYIAHDLTEEQAETVYQVFGQYYNILPEKYDPYKCFQLFEKDEPVYRIDYFINGNKYDLVVVGRNVVKSEVEGLYSRGEYYKQAVEVVGVNKMFI